MQWPRSLVRAQSGKTSNQHRSQNARAGGRLRPGWAAVAALALVGALIPGAGLAADPVSADPTSRFERVPFQGDFTPRVNAPGADPAQRVTVMVKLAGDPVALEQAKAPGKKISLDRKLAIERELKAKQDALRGLIAARGGTVLGEFQDAINGIKVEIPRNQLKSLAALPNVVGIKSIGRYEMDNATSVPFIGTPDVWQGLPAFHGENVKIAIIDTGIDYTHANFGGPGTVEAFRKAKATNTQPPDPSLFGPNAPKVKGGTDLVGDAYTGNNTPQPGPNPLDCNGHGSHVAGTAAGFGVKPDGSTYTGPYDATTPNQTFRVGPGVAPMAELYAVRVFGCDGFTRVVVEAIDWAVANGMDVINMSLGAAYGSADAASAEASENAAQAGLLVIASAGNSGPAPYITGSPAAGRQTVSVAASDANPELPFATLTLSTGKTLTVLNANEASFTDGTTLPVFVLRKTDGTISLGCDEKEYVDAQISGKLVVTLRGVCARVDRAIFGARHGAAAVAMINSSPGLPPFEGTIIDPAQGTAVGIPFFGVRGAERADLIAADTGTAALKDAGRMANPGFRRFASFTSGGPRVNDSELKPDITAPGVSTSSTAIGTGNLGRRLSGTSMAAPHVAGVAALVRQAHPDWDSSQQRAAIVNTGDPARVLGYRTSRGGSGLVQPVPATRTSTVVLNDEDTNLSFGFEDLKVDFSDTAKFSVRNLGAAPVSFNLSVAMASGSPHSTALDRSSLTVNPNDEAIVHFTLTVPAATAGDTRRPDGFCCSFREVAGLVTLTPASPGMNGGATLRLPYYMVPRARSLMVTRVEDEAFNLDNTSAVATVRNPNAAITGSADFYAWGLQGDKKDLGSIDLRAVGVQSLPIPGSSDRLLVFAINTHTRWSSPNVNAFEILVTLPGHTEPDFDVLGGDFGFFFGDGFDGQMVSAVVNLKTNRARIRFFADAPTDGATILLPALASDLGLSAANPRFSYAALSTSLRTAGEDSLPGPARFNAFNPAISQGQFVQVAPNQSTTVDVSINATEFALTPALGLMVVYIEDPSGQDQADLLPVSE